ncbi:hypothetical protein SRB5_46620 [Streptomyces sp. RB5]|uniref:Pepco domain-containing protein n=1 Tax=Streptomyces smaragdinus TaxID=2585196 RepID=A0A7K0CP14_9ACTN|nr:hypothetical protein [Streptomyces smaragdinus]MQY14494.1 hypothetical protein [Streptomyces smaragdinus]
MDLQEVHEDTTLSFWVADEGDDPQDTMGIFSRDSDAVLRSVPLGPLRKNLADTVEALQTIFAEVSQRSGTLPLAEAQLSFQVTASGGVQLIGTSQVQTGRGLTLTFRRP